MPLGGNGTVKSGTPGYSISFSKGSLQLSSLIYTKACLVHSLFLVVIVKNAPNLVGEGGGNG